MNTLKDAKVGQTYKVVKLHGQGAIKRRIMDMGITKGVQIYIRKFAPLGDPMELQVRGYELSLRKADADMIEVIVHRESIIHSMVEYIDNSVIAQLSVPDMRSCVQYALTYPDRCEGVIDRLDLFKISQLHFAKPDITTFSLLACAIEAGKKGGALPAVLNASNEIAVAAFLNRQISFCDIMDIVTGVVEKFSNQASLAHSLEEILCFDTEARLETRKIINSICN